MVELKSVDLIRIGDSYTVLVLSAPKEYRESSEMLLESGEELVKEGSLRDGKGEVRNGLLMSGELRGKS